MDMKGAVCILLLAWSWYTTIATTAAPAPSGATELSSVDSTIIGAPPEYPIVRFRADNADGSTYQEMIATLRCLLGDLSSYSHGILMLPEASDLDNHQRYILLEMTVSDASVTFAISASNLYIVAYFVSTTNTRHFFQEAEELDPEAREHLFPDAETTSTRVISANYQNLERIAGAQRSSIPLGLHSLRNAIDAIASGRGGGVDARGFIIVIQMVSEAVRYWEIERRVIAGSTFRPDALMLGLENNWGALSREIQRSEDGYSFGTSVQIGGFLVDNINSLVVSGLALMLAVCTSRRASLHQQHLDPVMMRRSDLEAFPLMLQLGGGGRYEEHGGDDDPEQCRVESNPKSRILGRDGMCVDVEKFTYRDDNPVIMYRCRASDIRNQLWTWTSDGRIVSLEKCLTASGNEPGSTVVIRECDILLEGSPSRWRMDETGNLVHINSKLVLTAGTSGSVLTVETSAGSSFQAWTCTNETMATAQGQPVMIELAGSNKCMYYSGSYVYTQSCGGGGNIPSPQKWRMYPDSTIRPVDYPDWCLALTYLEVTSSYNYITIGSCDEYPVYHRWIFTHGGIIRNVASKLVVDADSTSADYLQGAVETGAGNQIWRTWLIN